jgi:DNA-directed RNA polymerase beta subunit
MSPILNSPLTAPPTLAAPPAPIAAPPAPEPVEPETREFGDANAARKTIFERAQQAAAGIKPFDNGKHTLALENVHYQGPEDFSLAEQKQAILEGRSLGRRLRGTWRLKDNATGQEVENRTSTIATIPYLTPRGTFINRGSEYSIINQFRLNPGIYTRRKENGEIEAHVNVMPGEGKTHRYFLDPEKGVFYAKLGQAKVPLLPLLRAFGVNDKQLQEAWGPELYSSNLQNDSPAAINKYYERLLPPKLRDGDEPTKRAALVEAFRNMKLNPETTRRTLGQPFDKVDADTVLATTKKLLAVSRGEADVDDRDHLAYQTVVGPEDLIAERLSKDYGGLQRTLFRKASLQGNLRSLGAGALNKQVLAALLHSGLGQNLEETNASEIFDKQYRITRMGEGGIPSLDSIPDEARAVQPSHLSMVDPLRTPESLRAGVDVYLARAARKGTDGKIYAPFQDARTGKTIHRSAQDVADLSVAFPKEMDRPGKRAWALQNGKIRSVAKKDVDLIVPVFEDAFSPLANMIPFKSAVKGQRVAMGSRMITQALPLTKGEAPLVQTGVPGQEGMSYEELYGDKLGAIRADQPARVMNVSADGIQLRYADGREETKELANNFPYNRKTFFSQTPLVQPGAIVQPGQLLAKSNYVDDTGSAAMGLNARVAYMADGHNFEDAISISQSFADRLSSEHMYSSRLDKTDEHKLGRGSYMGLFPGRFSRRQLETIGENGVVKPGTRVEPGDPLILSAQTVAPSHNRVHKKGSKSFNDVSVTWDHHDPGEVTDVVDTDKGLAVFVKSVASMQVGDKLANRYGGKGVIGKIYSDDEMPRDRDGRPLDILVSPTGVISRGNPAQVIETVLGKIAEKTGKPYRVADFDSVEDLTTFAEQELAKHGLTDLEDVIEPLTQRKVPGILTGNQFFMKLQHTAEGKGQGRGTGGYTAEGAPAKGGIEGSKRIGLLTTNALLSHGATGVLRDASQIRGQRNEDFWLSYMQGYNPPDPDIPMVYKKFVANLQAAGVNVVSSGTGSHIMAMTNKDVDQLAGNRELKNGETVNFDRDLKPVAGGLFDPALTGGHNGNRWSYVKLAEPLPNPVMEEPIRRLLGLTQKQFDAVVSGAEELPRFGGKGPEAISNALSGLNLDREIQIARGEIAGSKKGARDLAVRRLGYLKSAKQLNVHPGDWMLDKVPVLPPVFRPISEMGDKKLPLVSDPNYLYRELIEANDNLREMGKEVDDVTEERSAVYNAFKAVTGLADPLHPKLQEKQVKGILQHVFSSSPKYGTVQRRLLSTTVDTVGRGVITPDPDLDMDSVGIPEDRAWDVYKNFVVRRLKRRGLSVLEAARHVDGRTQTARNELLGEMKERPVFVDRAPVLHRFGVMAFWPRLTKDDTVHVSPLVVKGFGADFDGDTVNYHVPVSDEARTEAMERMLPSRNLLSVGDFKTPMHAPGQDYVAGLYAATAKSKKKQRARRFMTKQDAIRAFHRGDAGVDTEIEVDS